MKIFKAMKWSSLVSGILLVLLGLVSLFSPGQNLVWLSVIISAIVLVSGIVTLVNYFTTDKADRSGWLLAEGILSTLIGAWMVFGSGSWALTAIIPYVFAVFVLALGITRVAEAFEYKAMGSGSWGWLLAFGILCILLGVLLFFAPLISATFLSVAVSMLVIGYGISNISRFITLQRAGNYIRKRFRDYE